MVLWESPRPCGGWTLCEGFCWLLLLPVLLLLAARPARLAAFPTSLSDCQTPTGWNCSGKREPRRRPPAPGPRPRPPQRGRVSGADPPAPVRALGPGLPPPNPPGRPTSARGGAGAGQAAERAGPRRWGRGEGRGADPCTRAPGAAGILGNTKRGGSVDHRKEPRSGGKDETEPSPSLKGKVSLKPARNNFMRKNKRESNKSNSDCGGDGFRQKCREAPWSRVREQVTRILQELGFPEMHSLAPSLPPSETPSLLPSAPLSHPPGLLGCKRRCFCSPEMLLSGLPKLLDGEGKLRKDAFVGLQAWECITEPGRLVRRRAEPTRRTPTPFLGRLPWTGSGAPLARRGPCRV